MAGLKLKTRPSNEPVTTAEAKSHLRIESDVTEDDTLIGTYIEAARSAVEAFTKRSLLTTTYEYYIDGAFPAEIRLPIGPVASITSIVYVDDAGSETTLATTEYQASLNGQNGVVRPAWGKQWPSTRPVLDAVKVTFKTGLSDPEDIPKAIRHGLLMMVAHLYENREPVVMGATPAEMPLGVRNLLTPYVRWN